MRTRLLAGITVAAMLGGCAKQRYRYIDLAASRGPAVRAALESATEQGICPLGGTEGESERLATLVRFGKGDGQTWRPLACDRVSAPKRGERPDYAPAAREPLPPWETFRSETILLTPYERPEGGTRIELSGKPRTPLERILPDAPARVYDVAGFFSRQTNGVIEPVLTFGGTSAGGRRFLEGEAGLRVGRRLWRGGGGEIDPAPENGLAVLVHAGIMAELHRSPKAISEDTPTLRLGLSLQYDRVDTVTPLPGRHIKQGMRALVRIDADVLLGKRNGVEAGLSAHPIDWFGLYARAGYQTGEHRGATFSAGAELGAGPSVYVYLTPVVLAGTYLLGSGIAFLARQRREMQ